MFASEVLRKNRKAARRVQPEIDENLMRSELTPTQTAEHLAKRKEVWGSRQSTQVAPIESKRDDGRGHRPTEFAADTAKATGIHKATINRAIARAENVCQEARDIVRGTNADTGTVLDRLKDLPPEQQIEAAAQEIQKRQQPAPVHITKKKKNL